MKVETLKITFLINNPNQAILNVHCSAKWPNKAKVGSQLVGRMVESRESLATDKGYDSVAFRAQHREYGVRPPIKHRPYRQVDHAHYARMNADRYNLRALTESVNSTVNQSILTSVSFRA